MVESKSIHLQKYAAKHSATLVSHLSLHEAAIMKIVDCLFKDTDEVNKIFLIDTVIELARTKSVTSLQSYFNKISYQFTWRIRYELISKVERLGEAMGKDNFKQFLNFLVKFINDIEPQIRSITCLKLSEVFPLLDANDILNRVLPALKGILTDSHAYVRSNSFLK